MKRVYNFSAGPCTLPESVLKEAASEMLDYKGSGMSVLEMSHRSAIYQEIFDNTKNLMIELLNIPENYEVLFLQGGASTQFAMVPLNLMNKYKSADYVNSGTWSKKAIAEAKKVGNVNIIASSEDKTFSYFPEIDKINKDIDYLHITSNNTIYGTKINKLPKTEAPIVADMSSNIMSEKIDVSDYGIIYAGAQKNLGPAGATVVIIRKDLVGKALENTPTMLNYETHTKGNSMFNTPPCYSIYIIGKVLKWVKDLGGVEEIEKINRKKAALLYNFLDSSKLFKSPVRVEDRSIMNIPFITGDENIDAKFIKEAIDKDFINLKGHRSIGGMRASIYNAMPIEGVEKLVKFMEEFEKNN